MIQIAADPAKLYTSFMEQKVVETNKRQNKESLQPSAFSLSNLSSYYIFINRGMHLTLVNQL